MRRAFTLVLGAACLVPAGCPRGEEAAQPPLPVGRSGPPATMPALAADAVRTRSGLQYVVERAGKPDAPASAPGDYVQVVYSGAGGFGAHANQSERRPLIFRLTAGSGQQGWDEGIVGMREGEKRTLLIPLRQGDAAPGAGSALRLNVELVKLFPKLTVQVTREGQGREAATGDFVTLHYTGTVLGGAEDGKKFESSYDDGQPLRFPLGSKDASIIEGWHDAVRGMKEGEKRTAVIPPQLAFGVEGLPGHIPPGATVRFEFELIKLEPGVTWTVEKPGSGEPAKAGDRVRVHYTGSFVDTEKAGQKFDSSFDHKPPDPLTFEIGAGRVIQGWEIGVTGMRPGEKRVLTIPPPWAYGRAGNQSTIPANATLRFEVELVEVAQ